MNRLSYHLILVNSSLRVLTEQIEQLSKCVESTFADASENKPYFAKVTAGKKKVYKNLKPDNKIILNLVYEKIKRTRKGISHNQIQEKTGLNRKQIANAIYKLKSRNMITTKSRGVYVKKC